MPLSDKLDHIWRSQSTRRASAREVIDRLDDSDLLHISAQIWCAQHDVVAERISMGSDEIEIETADGTRIRLSLKAARTLAPAIKFTDLNRLVYGPPNNKETQLLEMVSALVALQFARDRGDAIVLRPEKLRIDALREMAIEAQIDGNFVRALVAKFPITERAFAQ